VAKTTPLLFLSRVREVKHGFLHAGCVRFKLQPRRKCLALFGDKAENFIKVKIYLILSVNYS